MKHLLDSLFGGFIGGTAVLIGLLLVLLLLSLFEKDALTDWKYNLMVLSVGFLFGFVIIAYACYAWGPHKEIGKHHKTIPCYDIVIRGSSVELDYINSLDGKITIDEVLDILKKHKGEIEMEAVNTKLR